MKTTLIQLNIEWGSPLENIRRVERLLAEAPDSDLYVVPEMWSTGFATEPLDIAENEENSVSLQWMRSTAKRMNCAFSGSLAIKLQETNTYVNRHYFIDGRSQSETYYDKHHLFRYGGEDQYYQSGEAHTIVEYCGFRILLLTCYDLRFPVWSRYADALQYDAIIAVAMENQAYLIGCNRVGDDNYSHYRGQSAIISPIGKTLVNCQANKEQTHTISLDLEVVKKQRTKFKVLDDRDIK